MEVLAEDDQVEKIKMCVGQSEITLLNEQRN